MKKCPHCGGDIGKYDNPFPTADILIYSPGKGLVLVERKNPPYGLALPGGFIETGESAEHAAIREAKEETNLDIRLLGIIGVYSVPNRDPRFHTLTTAFVAEAADDAALKAGDDAGKAVFRPVESISGLCFDHDLVIGHFRDWLAGRRPLLPCGDGEI
jgi:8-oxo-dGTP diphosphatase